jgi:transglutaminase-like putative cysteine protease
MNALGRRATLLSGTLAETAAALERVERPDASREFAYLRERLLLASRSLEADFASTESKRSGLGLPEKTAAWREFVGHYRSRLAEVDAELAALAARAGDLSRAQLRARRAALRAKFGATSVARPPKRVIDTGPARPPVGGLRFEAAPAAESDQPTPEHLEETRIVQLTPEIRARAVALGRDAAALNAWVATSVEYSPYNGQMQNSQAVLLSRRGNDFDQATLLIALLRASGIPARYVGERFR